MTVASRWSPTPTRATGPDVTQFTAVIDALLARYQDLTEHVESLTVVSDAGQNSCDHHTRIEQAGVGFVGSLPPSDHPDLLAIGTVRYTPVDADRYPNPAGALRPVRSRPLRPTR